MSRLLISIAIGVVAGGIDVAPMLLQQLGWHACLSAFMHWVLLSVLISYVQLPLPPWLNGIAIAVLACLPIVILVSATDAKSVVPIVVMSVLLGAAVGFATARFAR